MLCREQLKSQYLHKCVPGISIITQKKGIAIRLLAYSWYAVSARSLGIEKHKRPDHLWSCAGPHTICLIFGLESLWSKHETLAAGFSDDVESEVQAKSVSVTEFRCGSHRQVLIGTYFSSFNIDFYELY